MSLIKLDSEIACSKEIEFAFKNFFDQVAYLDPDDTLDYQLVRVSKDSLNLVYNDDNIITVTIERKPMTTLAGTTIEVSKVIAVNDVSVDGENHGHINAQGPTVNSRGIFGHHKAKG